MAKKDFYELLNVTKSSSMDEIKSSYRKLAMKYHPDRNPDNKEMEEKFKEIAEAYEVLGNQEKRSKYDKYGFNGIKGSTRSYNNMSDIFSQFGDIFGGNFNFSSNNKDNDIKIDIELSLEETVLKIEKTVVYEKNDKCVHCDGTGSISKKINKCDTCNGSGVIKQAIQFGNGMQMTTNVICPKCGGIGLESDNSCTECNGKGVKHTKVTKTFTIDPGVRNGSYIVIQNAGNAGKFNSNIGNVILFFRVKDHPYFSIRGNDVIYNLKLNFTDLVLGAKVSIPTLYGKESITINPGTQSSHIINLPNKGLLIDSRSGAKGQQYTTISVNVPTSVTKSERDLLIKLSESDTFKSLTNNK